MNPFLVCEILQGAKHIFHMLHDSSSRLWQAIMQDKHSYPFLPKLDTNQNKSTDTKILVENKQPEFFIII